LLFFSYFEAAAAHPRLERLELQTSYPARGPFHMAFMGILGDLLRQGRADMLKLTHVIEGMVRQESRDFRVALRAAGYPLSEADSVDLV